MKIEDIYLGDGVYASFDGYHIVLDLRGQDTGYRFAFWNTVTDRFVSVGQDQAWDDMDDLKEGAMLAGTFINRLEGLCPAWASVPDRRSTDED